MLLVSNVYSQGSTLITCDFTCHWLTQ